MRGYAFCYDYDCSAVPTGRTERGRRAGSGRFLAAAYQDTATGHRQGIGPCVIPRSQANLD
jgi:hypothetical protein